MKIGIGLLVVVVAIVMGGCGGGSGASSSLIAPSSPFNGIYRTSFTRGTSAVTIYMNYPEVEVVVSDEANAYPSYFGSSSSAATTSGSTVSFTLPLNGSDGETASATGTFVAGSTGSSNSVTFAVTGGIGFSGSAPFATSTTNSLYVGTYSGTYQSTYTVGSNVLNEPAGAVTGLTLAAVPATGGYVLNATGTTDDPTGAPINFTITNAQVDPCGIVSNLSVVYSYPGGSSASVTNTYPSAYLNLGVVSTTSLVGFLKSTTTNWSDGAQEADTLVLTQSSTSSARPGKTTPNAKI